MFQVSTSMSVMVSKVALVGVKSPSLFQKSGHCFDRSIFFVQTEGLRVFGAPGDIITQTI